MAVVSFWVWGSWLHTAGVSIQNGLPTKTIHLGDADVVVEVASTPDAEQRGLSGRPSLPEGRGMLFDMGSDSEWGFWMKDMAFAIDIVWLAKDGRVVYIASNVSPSTYPEVFKPDAPARYVLELPAGYTAAAGVGVGDKIVL